MKINNHHRSFFIFITICFVGVLLGSLFYFVRQRQISRDTSLHNLLINPPDGLLFQGIIGPHSLQTYQNLSLDTKFSSAGDRQPTFLIGRYQSWTQDEESKVDLLFLNRVRQVGAIPYLTWEPWLGKSDTATPSLQPTHRLRYIARGDFDDYVHAYALGLKKYHYPIFLRFAHEMNGNWYPWGGTVNGNAPSDYVAAWRHLHDIFVQEGADNVLWVWSPNEPFSGKYGSGSEQYDLYYPGSAYVDWVGFSAYNWGKSSEYSFDRSFSDMVTKAYALLLPYHKPILLSETNSSVMGVDKAAWIKKMKTDLSLFPLIKGIVWYESDGDLFQIEKELF